MPKLTSALMVRNEGGLDRYLRPVLAACQRFSDEIVVLDDYSDDDTVEICNGFGAEVTVRGPEAERAWGSEAKARSELWDLAVQACPDGKSWVLFVDADMVLHGDPRPLLATRQLNSWAFPLYDQWSDTQYRSDDLWRGHLVPRIWLVAPRRVPQGWQPIWDRDALHVGHIPASWPAVPAVAPSDIYYLHMAYVTPSLRRRKHEQYLSRRSQLTPHETAHAESILDWDGEGLPSLQGDKAD